MEAVPESDKRARFDRGMLPHLNAAFNLARWLMRNPSDAEDAVQEAYLRAFRFFDGFEGGDGRSWLLAIVRNTCRSTIERSRSYEKAEFHEETHVPEYPSADPEERLLKQGDIDSVRWCIDSLPAE